MPLRLYHIGQGGRTSCAASEAGFTLPYVIVMAAISLMAVGSVGFLSVHFLSITGAEDGERLYYALDAAVEEVFADLVRGADGVDSSYTTPTVAINDVTTTISVTTTGPVSAPSETQQYFDPGVRHPHLKNGVSDKSYVLQVFNVRSGSILNVNWAFDLAGVGSEVGKLELKLFFNRGDLTPGQNTGCPVGAGLLEDVNTSVAAPGSFNLQLGNLSITQQGLHTIAFCIESMLGTFTTKAFKPSGQSLDTWVYAIAYKDYKITASADGAFVTAWVRQMPGPTEPPTGNWSDTNISWITNLVTPYRWDR